MSKKKRLFWNFVALIILMIIGVPLPIAIGLIILDRLFTKLFIKVAKKYNIPLRKEFSN
jgi:hypothetical protein